MVHVESGAHAAQPIGLLYRNGPSSGQEGRSVDLGWERRPRERGAAFGTGPDCLEKEDGAGEGAPVGLRRAYPF